MIVRCASALEMPLPNARSVRRSALPPAVLLSAMLVAILVAGCAAPARNPALAAAASAPQSIDPVALADAMGRQPIVLLGEVHDNANQHAMRAQALQRLVARGARPAIAFEQIDRDRQGAIDAIRADDSPDVATRADRIIQGAGAKGWDWKLYRPYVVIALEHDLPIVGANLSRSQAMRVATEGYAAVFDGAERASLGLDVIPQDVERAQEYEIERGHCGQLPADSLPAMAGAQIARDAVLAQSITPYAARGVVLLTGNGHARRDIGVLRHLAARDQMRVVAIGLLEDDARAADYAGDFDVTFVTPVQARADPCANFPHAPVAPRPGIGTR
jgi:uncharacterized iron-regulated protein